MSYRQTIAHFEKRSVMLFAALALGTAGAAFAQGTAPAAGAEQDVPAMFQKADKNGDKSLSMDEAKSISGLTEQFKAVDTNGDGKISLEELAAAMKK